MAEVRFIDITKSPVEMAADLVIDEVNERGIIEFSQTIFILPTRSAVRNVRNILLERVANGSVGALGGFNAFTPEMFISYLGIDFKKSAIFDDYAVWFSVFENLKWEHFQTLLPRGLPSRSEYMGFAESLSLLRESLSEIGLRISDLTQKFKDFDDIDRFKELALLEEKYFTEFEKVSRKSPYEYSLNLEKIIAKREFKNFKRIVLLGVNDVAPIFTRALECLKDKDIQINVFADSCDKDKFDEWGRPTERWIETVIDLNDVSIMVAPDVVSQSKMIASAIRKYDDKASAVCALACDSGESTKQVEEAFAFYGMEAYSPRKDSYVRDSRIVFLMLLGNFIRSLEVEDFSVLLRSPILLNYLNQKTGFEISEILESFDEFRQNSIPFKFELMEELAESDSVVGKIAETVRKRFIDVEHNAEFLEGICNEFFCNKEADEDYIDEVFEFLKGEILEFEKTQISFGNILNLSEVIALIMKSASKKYFVPQKDFRTIQIFNWVEVYWARQSQLILADMNDGIVPRMFSANTYLPERAMRELGMRTADAITARDAYMLDVMIKSRVRSNGGVAITIPRKNGNGDIVNVSRILLQCHSDKLSERIRKFFVFPEGTEKNVFFEKSWNLKIPFAKLPEFLSPSAFNSYLNCPFRFYLDYVLRLKSYSGNFDELGFDKLGSIFHKALERFVKFNSDENDDAKAIASKISKNLDRIFYGTYGKNCASELLFQITSLKRRIPAFVKCQLSLMEQGYKTLHTEYRLSNLEIGGFKINMIIDRIDEAPDGSLLVIDYKLKDSLSGQDAAQKAHYPKVRTKDGMVRMWKDLQLPIYKEAVSKLYPDRKVICAYFIISSDDTKTGLSIWDIDAQTQASALAEARRITSEISARNFKPTKNVLKYDNYEGFFDFASGNLVDFLEFENE